MHVTFWKDQAYKSQHDFMGFFMSQFQYRDCQQTHTLYKYDKFKTSIFMAYDRI